MTAFQNDQQRQLYDAVIWWQQVELFHPLTCRDSQHRPLQPTIIENGSVVLFCEDCDYVQAVTPALSGMLLASYGDRETLDALAPFDNLKRNHTN